jgi:hypothetical protein
MDAEGRTFHGKWMEEYFWNWKNGSLVLICRESNDIVRECTIIIHYIAQQTLKKGEGVTTTNTVL